MKPVALKDIARRAKVHLSTVSLALRNSPNLPERTRARLQRIARQMGYRPNPLVSALMAQRGRRKAVEVQAALAYLLLYPKDFLWQQNPLHRSIFQGVCERAAEFGFTVTTIDLTELGLTAERLESILAARGIVGLLMPPFVRASDSLRQLNWSRFAAVSLGTIYPHAMIDHVSNDNYQSMRLIHQRCRELGYRRIGFVMNASLNPVQEFRFSAADKLEQDNLPKAERVRPLFADMRPGIDIWPRETLAWCERERPDVIVTPVSQHAKPWLEFIRHLPGQPALVSLSVPRDNGPLAGIFQDGYEIGSVGAQILVNKIYRNEVGEQSKRWAHLLAGVWLDGPSCPPRITGRRQA